MTRSLWPRQRRTRRLLAILLCTALATVPLSGGTPAVAAGPGITERVSVDSSGAQANLFGSYSPSISADGEYVAFGSSANNLVAGDANGETDVFLRHRLTGATELVSVDSSGTQGNNNSYETAISAGGRIVAFNAGSSNLVVGDTNGVNDIFVRDRITGVTERVSVDSNGAQGNDHSSWPSISANGRYVAFSSVATNLVAGDTNHTNDVFVRDRLTGTTERVSVGSGGAQAGGSSFLGYINADGRYVVFISLASDLVSGDTNSEFDIFVRDRLTGVTERVSVDSNGAQGNGQSYGFGPSINADGRYVTFYSSASNLVDGDTNSQPDIFLRDRVNGETERLSVDSSGAQANGFSSYASINADGRYVTFVSQASNLVVGDTNGADDIFLRDRLTGETERVSVDSGGDEANGRSSQPAISADGRYVAFYSAASNLVAGDTNGTGDIFLRDRCPDGIDSDGDGFWNCPPSLHEGPANTDFTTDNCPAFADPSQLNADGNFTNLHPTKSYDDRTWPNSDASGDACDSDDDNDGIQDLDEIAGTGVCGVATNPLVRDSDGDRILDGAECTLATDPNVINATPVACSVAGDVDLDGVSDAREFCYYNTNPNTANTDGDACSDGKEVASINADNTVHGTDLSQVAQHFGTYTLPAAPHLINFDITKDGNINATDLSQIAQRFGPC